jgi:LPXTG-motif cell wall-anchored protein
MRFFRSLVLVAVLLLWATPASGAEVLEMTCPVCDHVDVDGRGLEPNATLTLIITDVGTGQDVVPATRVTTDSSGSFSREFELDLSRHPGLLANLYEPNGSDLVLAAHANAQAPAHCRRATSLPYTGSSQGLSAGVAAGLLVAGASLLLVTRRRKGSVAGRPDAVAGGPPAGR